MRTRKILFGWLSLLIVFGATQSADAQSVRRDNNRKVIGFYNLIDNDKLEQCGNQRVWTGTISEIDYYNYFSADETYFIELTVELTNGEVEKVSITIAPPASKISYKIIDRIIKKGAQVRLSVRSCKDSLSEKSEWIVEEIRQIP